jgi:hypothetical protein
MIVRINHGAIISTIVVHIISFGDPQSSIFFILWWASLIDLQGFVCVCTYKTLLIDTSQIRKMYKGIKKCTQVLDSLHRYIVFSSLWLIMKLARVKLRASHMGQSEGHTIYIGMELGAICSKRSLYWSGILLQWNGQINWSNLFDEFVCVTMWSKRCLIEVASTFSEWMLDSGVVYECIFLCFEFCLV